MEVSGSSMGPQSPFAIPYGLRTSPRKPSGSRIPSPYYAGAQQTLFQPYSDAMTPSTAFPELASMLPPPTPVPSTARLGDIRLNQPSQPRASSSSRTAASPSIRVNRPSSSRRPSNGSRSQSRRNSRDEDRSETGSTGGGSDGARDPGSSPIDDDEDDDEYDEEEAEAEPIDWNADMDAILKQILDQSTVPANTAGQNQFAASNQQHLSNEALASSMDVFAPQQSPEQAYTPNGSLITLATAAFQQQQLASSSSNGQRSGGSAEIDYQFWIKILTEILGSGQEAPSDLIRLIYQNLQRTTGFQPPTPSQQAGSDALIPMLRTLIEQQERQQQETQSFQHLAPQVGQQTQALPSALSPSGPVNQNAGGGGLFSLLPQATPAEEPDEDNEDIDPSYNPQFGDEAMQQALDQLLNSPFPMATPPQANAILGQPSPLPNVVTNSFDRAHAASSPMGPPLSDARRARAAASSPVAGPSVEPTRQRSRPIVSTSATLRQRANAGTSTGGGAKRRRVTHRSDTEAGNENGRHQPEALAGSVSPPPPPPSRRRGRGATTDKVSHAGRKPVYTEEERRKARNESNRKSQKEWRARRKAARDAEREAARTGQSSGVPWEEHGQLQDDFDDVLDENADLKAENRLMKAELEKLKRENRDLFLDAQISSRRGAGSTSRRQPASRRGYDDYDDFSEDDQDASLESDRRRRRFGATDRQRGRDHSTERGLRRRRESYSDGSDSQEDLEDVNDSRHHRTAGGGGGSNRRR